MREPCLDYFYGNEAEVGSFCRLPRIFVTDEFYRAIPMESGEKPQKARNWHEIEE